MPRRTNLENLKFDLSEKESSGFVEMLKALISRMLMDDKDISTITADPSSEEATKFINTLKEKADTLFDDLLSSAVEFCNKDLNTNPNRKGKTKGKKKESDDIRLCRAMKESIRKYCNVCTEATRYKHLVSVLNNILCNFRSHKFKDLITPAEMGDSELIFIMNDPVFIKTDIVGTERKPDMIATSPDTLNSWFEDSEGRNWTQWWSKINNGSKTPVGIRRRWLDVLQPWALKIFNKRLQPKRLKEAYSGQDFTAAALGDDQVTDRAREKESKQAAPTATRSAKRKRESDDDIESTAFKKKKKYCKNDPPSRQSHASDARFTSAPAEQLSSPDVQLQLATYALERLCAAWNITHTTGISLLDTQLQLWYYDSQGCIQTHHIDILQELPLFVVMVMIFQRFDRRMWGVRDTKIACAEQSKTYRIVEETEYGPRFELCGRRLFTAYVSGDVQDSCMPKDSDADSHRISTRAKAKADAQPASEKEFFKAAWPEVPRKKEPAILEEARRRADKLLQEPFRSYVKDHIPKMDAWEELPDTSTVLIRCFLGLSTENSRVQIWMVSTILKPAQMLAPRAFWVALWEAIRCHYLLWRIGIVHGDISLNNIMYDRSTKKCILNDYDLATLMDPGTEVPDCKGYECAGTKPFMAYDLLKAYDAEGQAQRRFRHDFESFCWVLFWVGACVQRGEETLTGPFAEMVAGTHRDVALTKSILSMNLRSYSTTKDYDGLRDFIVDWMAWWSTFQMDMNTAVYQQRRHGIPVKEEPAEYFLNALVKTAAEAAHPAPIKLDWLSVDVRGESTKSATSGSQ